MFQNIKMAYIMMKMKRKKKDNMTQNYKWPFNRVKKNQNKEWQLINIFVNVTKKTVMV